MIGRLIEFRRPALARRLATIGRQNKDKEPKRGYSEERERGRGVLMFGDGLP